SPGLSSPGKAPLASCCVQKLAVQLEPRGLLYTKLTLVEQWDPPRSVQEPRVFGVALRQLVEREAVPTKVPLLIQKCVAQIERRGLKVVGLYRLCGSAAVKKELRDAFERDSATVTLSENLYPDINVITGILKDYLRELPTPLITRPLYQVVLEAMSRRPPQSLAMGQEVEETLTLLDCLPEAEKVGAQSWGAGRGGPYLAPWKEILMPGRSPLSYPSRRGSAPYRPAPEAEKQDCSSRLRQKCQLTLGLESAVVARSRPRGLESPPSNRYAGDWSVCGQQFLEGPSPGGDADYEEVAGSDSDNEELELREGLARCSQTVLVGDFALVEDAEAPFGPCLNLKDFDALILDLERELSKQINVCL
uniref:Synapse defective Rho GTPase homolog 1 n=1 Tax=Sphenodon punctatus TaxID=8508 RepID=A0A8D0L1U5_SPHPU